MHVNGYLRRLINKWESRIFAVEDAVARGHGWQISRPPNGFGRVYRDPRWDLISECELCGGEGGSAAEQCQRCGGRGTVRRSLTAPRGGAS